MKLEFTHTKGAVTAHGVVTPWGAVVWNELRQAMRAWYTDHPAYVPPVSALDRPRVSPDAEAILDSLAMELDLARSGGAGHRVLAAHIAEAAQRLEAVLEE